MLYNYSDLHSIAQQRAMEAIEDNIRYATENFWYTPLVELIELDGLQIEEFCICRGEYWVHLEIDDTKKLMLAADIILNRAYPFRAQRIAETFLNEAIRIKDEFELDELTNNFRIDLQNAILPLFIELEAQTFSTENLESKLIAMGNVFHADGTIYNA